MSADLYEKLKSKLRKKQSPERFRHSVSVGEVAMQLAKKHGWNPARARLAGLLHDYAKEWTPQKMARYVEKNNLPVPDLDFVRHCAPNMMHAYVAAHVVEKKRWLTAKNDLRAIQSHTLGRKKMSLEEKILYIADFSEPGRPYAATAAAIRALALADIDAAFRDTLTNKIGWQLKKGKPVHPFAISVWNRVVCHVEN
jgi:predicted HD superfamily hydrolase involved in NAD metabolism